MCGRYKYTPGEFADLRIRWNLDGDLPLFKSYNIAPTQNVLLILQKDGRNYTELLRWGLVLFWAKDIAIGNQMINARADTLTEKPAFKGLVKDRRCAVLADGF
jgi:putative SOS response-associated peptidase YedK